MNDRLIDRNLGRYHVESLVDTGGMGAVYRARDTKLDRTVALKVLAESRTRDESFRQRFLRESRMLASIDHPNIVPVFEADEADGELYIAMRFINGPDLGTLVHERGPLDPALAVSIVSQMGDALDYAHAQGMVHRDIKPANIMVVENPSSGSMHAYLTDFGLTKVVGASQGLTEAGGFVGTSAYVAPEQIQGKSIDHRADVYSLGCVLYDLLTGSVPFPRDSTHASLWAHVNEPPPKPTRSRDNLPPAFDAVIEQALAKNPEDRFQTAGGLALAARHALTGEAAAVPPIPVPLPPGAVPPKPSAQRTEIRTITGIAAVAAAAGTAEVADGAAGAAAAAAGGIADETAIAGRGAGSTELRPLMAATPPMAAPQAAGASATVIGAGAATQLAGAGGAPTELADASGPPTVIVPGSTGAGGGPPRRRRAGAIPVVLAGAAGLFLVGTALATGGFGLAGSPSPSRVAFASIEPGVSSPSVEPAPGGSGDADSASPDVSSSPSPSESAPVRPNPPSNKPSASPRSGPTPTPAPVDEAGPTGGKVRVEGLLSDTVTTSTTVKVTVTTKPTDKSGIDQIACSNTSKRPGGQSYKSQISCKIAGGQAGSRTVYVWFRDKSPQHNWSSAVIDRINFDRAPVARNMLYDMTNAWWCSHTLNLPVIGGPGVQATDPDGNSTIKIIKVVHGSTSYDHTATAVQFGSTPSTATQVRYYVDYTIQDTYKLTATGRLSYDTGPCP